MSNADRPGGPPRRPANGSGSGGGFNFGGFDFRFPGRGPDGRSLLGTLAYWGAVAFVWLAIFVVAFFVIFSRGLPDTSKLYEIHRQPSITYLDRSGSLLGVRGSQYAPPVDIDKLPEYVPAAFVAIEDHNFYHHMGFDAGGIIRSFGRNLMHRRGPLAGGSTITQQLARNLFLTPDQTMKRKAQELMLAFWLERKFSKKQILALYMNRVYFGAGAYGIEAAAQRYFNKPASELTVGEAALLAGLLKSPTHYSPVSDQDRAARRATIVLDRMVETGAITTAQRDDAFQHPVKVSKTLASSHAQYFVDWVDTQVRQLVGQPETDLVVETTLDLPLDALAQQAAATVVAKQQAAGVQQAAVVAMDGVGRVRALIGGVNYGDSQFNRAVEARRQAGSSWKPFVYLTAMEQGRTPDVHVVDEPVTINGWTPHNYTNKYLGDLTLQQALAQSINTVAARLADEVGRQNVANVAHTLGIKSPINTDPAMALGTTQVSPLEMAQAYAPFSNGGDLATAFGIERIRTADGKVLYEHHPEARQSVIGNPALTYMNQMLRTVITSGTGTRAAISGYDLAGKTGTTSDYKDAWFMGYTGGFVTAVWVGKDNNTPMHKVTGGGAPAEIWRAFMATALPHLQVHAIPSGPQAEPGLVMGDPIGDLLAHTTASPPPNDNPPPTPEIPDAPPQPDNPPMPQQPPAPSRPPQAQPF
jgi:penicillin-binding protein 1A